MNKLRLIIVFSLTFLLSSLAKAEVGYITEVSEGAQLIRGDSVFSLQSGVALDSEDVISTGEAGHAQMEMQDGSVLELGPSGQIHLSEYQLNQQKQVEKAEISLVTGWLRFVTAKLSRTRAYSFTTPTMTIGIRGTEGTINAGEDLSSLSLNEGEVEVAELDEAGQSLPPDRLRAGEYVERRQGQRLQLFKQAPASFKNKLPERFKKRVVRRLKELKKRGLSPKQLRKVAFKDLKKIVRNNPKIRDRLMNRFEKRFQDPKFRENFRKYIQKHPGIKNRLKNNPKLNKKIESWKKNNSKKVKRDKRIKERERQRKQ